MESKWNEAWKKEGKKDEIFYRIYGSALYVPEVLWTRVAFCKRANENCAGVPYKTYLLRKGSLLVVWG